MFRLGSISPHFDSHWSFSVLKMTFHGSSKASNLQKKPRDTSVRYAIFYRRAMSFDHADTTYQKYEVPLVKDSQTHPSMNVFMFSTLATAPAVSFGQPFSVPQLLPPALGHPTSEMMCLG